MKRLFLLLCFLFLVNTACQASITVSQFVTADDVTITHLETFRKTVVDAINSADGGLLTAGSVTSAKLDANTNPENRWDEAFSDWVYTGLTIPTSVNLTSTTTSGTAFIEGVRVVKDATSKAYTASKHTFVDLSKTGTYTYSEVAINAAEPVIASNSIRLARVSTDTTTVLSVRDDRSTAMTTLGSTGMIFEGATADVYETTLAVTDPTADRTITLPDSSGTITFNPINIVRAYLNTSQDNLTNDVSTKILLDTESFDVNNEFTSNRFTAKTAGYYLIIANISWINIVADKSYQCEIYVNGALAAIIISHSSLASDLRQGIANIAYLSVGGYVELYGTQSSGVDTVDVGAGTTQTYLAIHRISD